MNNRNSPIGRAFGVALVFAALFGAGLVLARTAGANGSDFSGFYRVSDVSISGETATLTLTLRFFNHGSADVSNATIVLHDWLVPTRNYASFSNVSVAAGKTVQVTGTFQIPQREFQSWQHSRQPFLMIEYADATGNKVRRPIEVVRSHFPSDARPANRP